MKFDEAAWSTLTQTKSNIFLTGKAGTGKSRLIKTYIDWARAEGQGVAVLAPTGLAALNIGGQTIHSFFGFKTDVTLNTAWINGDAYKRLERCRTIVIDEASMLRADMFRCILVALRRFAGKAKVPVDSIRIILVGDLFQLPPVVPRDLVGEFSGGMFASPYFFSGSDERFDYKVVELTEIYRQTDSAFVNALNAVRQQDNLLQFLPQLNARVGKLAKDKQVVTVCATNKRADSINEQELDKLEGDVFLLSGKNDGIADNALPTSVELKLKACASVMLLSNDLEGRWVNGTQGKVVGFEPIMTEVWSGEQQAHVEALAPAVQVEIDGSVCDVLQYTWEIKKLVVFKNEKTGNEELESQVVGSFKQFPIKLAWAVTIHKSQGQTYENVHIELPEGNLFAEGQLYVALSRCTSLEGLSLSRAIRVQDALVSKAVVEYYASAS